MKIFLLNPPFIQGFGRSVRGSGEVSRGGTLYFPIWLAYAAGCLEISHTVRLIDAQARKWDLHKVLDDCMHFNPDICVVESNFSSLANDIYVSNEIKNLSGAKTILVGPPTSQYPHEILSKGIDICVMYEYDLTLQEVAAAVQYNTNLSDVKGISYIKDGIEVHNERRDYSNSNDLDEIPFVSKVYKDHLNINDYFLSSSLYPVVQILTGRGCPNQCTFCSWPSTFTGRKYRERSISNIIEEFRYIESELKKAKEVFIEDDTFTINKKRVYEFCSAYLDSGLEIPWSCNARANTLDLNTMIQMKKANCRMVIVGYESGSQQILNNIKKGVTLDQMKHFSLDAKKAGLMVHGDFIIGLPGETRDTIKETRELIKELKPDILQVLIPQPIPGTELYKWYKENGYLLIDNPIEYLDENGYQRSIVFYPDLSNTEILSAANSILKDYYMSYKYIPLAFRQICRKNGAYELMRLAYSAKMFMGYILGVS